MNESKLSDEALAELLTLTVEVGEEGDIRYYDQQGQLHRIHGPAVIWAGGDGSKLWYQNNLLHRTDGPAVDWGDGSKAWYLNGEHITESEFNERIKYLR